MILFLIYENLYKTFLMFVFINLKSNPKSIPPSVVSTQKSNHSFKDCGPTLWFQPMLTVKKMYGDVYPYILRDEREMVHECFA